MLKKIVIALLLLFVVSCSSPQERYEIAEKTKLGKVIYQRYSKADNTEDIFILQNCKNELYVVKVSSVGSIYDIESVKEIKCE